MTATYAKYDYLTWLMKDILDNPGFISQTDVTGYYLLWEE